jgi:hypothetical protein
LERCNIPKSIDALTDTVTNLILYGIGGRYLTFLITSVCLLLLMKSAGMLNGSSTKKRQLSQLAGGVGGITALFYAKCYFTNDQNGLTALVKIGAIFAIAIVAFYIYSIIKK